MHFPSTGFGETDFDPAGPMMDGIMKLAQAGVITGAKKSLLRGKMVTSFVMGSRALYEWAHDNPALEMRGTEFTNSPRVIADNDRMVSVNSALAVDLTGQVAADTLMGKFFSGIGGQVDFVRGAAASRGARRSLSACNRPASLPCHLLSRDSVAASQPPHPFPNKPLHQTLCPGLVVSLLWRALAPCLPLPLHPGSLWTRAGGRRGPSRLWCLTPRAAARTPLHAPWRDSSVNAGINPSWSKTLVALMD